MVGCEQGSLSYQGNSAFPNIHTGALDRRCSGPWAPEHAAETVLKVLIQECIEERVETGAGIAEAGDDVGDANDQCLWVG